MNKRMNIESPLITDILFDKSTVTHHNQGIDTIQLVAKYSTFISMVERMGLKVQTMPKSNKVFKKIDDEIKLDSKKRLKKESFSPVVERINLPKVNPKDKALFISVVRNTPMLFDVATQRKKAKDTYCLITFAGLHQPTKKISSDAMKIISKFLKRKAFTLHSLDVAIDTTDYRSISHERKGAFKDNLMPYAKHGVISKGSSLYINKLDHILRISRILYYDKYVKQTQHHKQKGISHELRNWKRLEITFTFDVTDRNNKGFTHYVDSLNFVDDLCEIREVAKLAGIKSYESDYLTYQLNSILDNRFMNNQESKRQFNSVESLARFKVSDFRRYILAI